MAKTSTSGADFISSIFKPNILIISSTDAELLCIKNHLTFTDLLKPFSLINKDVLLRDQNNINHTIKNLHINFIDNNSTPLTQFELKKLLNDIVLKSYNINGCNTKFVQHGNSEISIPTSTPWFETWRNVFLENIVHSDHEFLNHYLACIFVVSTFNNDITDQFQRLNQQLTQFQNNHSSKFFNINILKYYVLLHDQGQGDKSKAEELYKQLRGMYGMSNCFLLSINSASTINPSNNIINNTENSVNSTDPQPDPWLQFLVPGGNIFNDLDINQKINCDQNFDEIHNEPMNCYDDPLSLFKSDAEKHSKLNNSIDQQRQHNNVKNSTSYPMLHTAATNYKCNFLSHDSSTYNNDSNEISKIKSDIHKPHGQCLSTSDHERIREFVYEFVSFALIPWVENTLKHLSEQIAYKMKMTRGLFNVTRKFFGGSSTSTSKGPINSNFSGSSSNLHTSSSTSNIGSTKVVYTSEAIEMQMRRHADLAFLFQQYELAHQTYNVLKKDFHDDAAWLHYAGVMEMSALSVFLQGSSSQRQYPMPLMDAAINIYASQNRNIDYATRAALLNCEALKSQGQYLQASNQFIKLTTEENDLRSALLLEQSAHFYVHSKVPMLRKYAFHLILAGYRFSKAGQKHHAIRCYTQALPIFKGKNWILAEDHIYATISKHAYSQNQLKLALDALTQLLSKFSRQTPSLQVTHLRDYLKIYKELIENKSIHNSPIVLPQFTIPNYDTNSIKVMLGQPSKQFDDVSVEAKDIEFSDDEIQLSTWHSMEILMLDKIFTNNLIQNRTVRPKIDFIRPSCLSKITVNKQPADSVIGEPITIQLFLENPLHIPLVLTDVYLLWKFKSINNAKNTSNIPLNVTLNDEVGDNNNINEQIYNNIENDGDDNNENDDDNDDDDTKSNNSICNEYEQHDDSPQKQEYVVSENIHELCLLPKEKKPVEISVIPRHLGYLELKGLTFFLNSSSPNQKLSGNNATSLSSNFNSYDSGNESDPLDLPVIKLRGKLQFDLASHDKRLHFNIVQSMPKLKVVFSEFPKSLAIDELYRTSMTISNIGKESMKNLFLFIKPYNNITLGINDHNTIIKNSKNIFTNIYSTTKSNTTNDNLIWNMNQTNDYNDDEKIYGITLNQSVDDNSQVLLPGYSIQVPLWIRCTHKDNKVNIGSEKVPFRFLFYYEPAFQNTKQLKYRFLRHKSEVDLKPTISVHGSLIRCRGLNECSYLANLKMENHSHPSDRKIVDFEIYQITTISKSWKLSEEISNSNKMVIVGPRETHSIHLKLIQHASSTNINKSTNNNNQYVYSNIQFNPTQHAFVQTNCCPCSDFFHYDYYKHHTPLPNKDIDMSINNEENIDIKPQQFNKCPFNMVQDKISFIILWKAVVKYSKEFQSEHFGQSHVFTSFQLDSNFPEHTLMKPSSISLNPDLSYQQLLSKVQFNTTTKTTLTNTLQPFYQYSKFINICYNYQNTIDHDFLKYKKLILPVTIVLLNTSSQNVMVRIEPMEPPDSLSSASFVEGSDPSSVVNDNNNTNKSQKYPDSLTNNNGLNNNSNLTNSTNNNTNNNQSSQQSGYSVTKVTWLGVCSRQSIISAHNKLSLKFRCLITRPGIYEVQGLQVRAATLPSSQLSSSTSSDFDYSDLTFIKQDNMFSSILTVNNKLVQIE